MMNSQNKQKKRVALKAVEFVRNGDIVGVGTGSTANFATEELGRRFKEGLKITAVASSIKTQQLAKSFGIPVIELGTVEHIDINIDGADEFTEQLDLIKGGGGALFREKIVASLSANNIIITDASKKVAKLGSFKVPIEVSPNAVQYVTNQLKQLNGNVQLRTVNNARFLTDQQNYVIDVDFGLIADPANLNGILNQITGIIEHGLFVNLASMVLMADEKKIKVFTKSN